MTNCPKLRHPPRFTLTTGKSYEFMHKTLVCCLFLVTGINWHRLQILQHRDLAILRQVLDPHLAGLLG